MSPTQPQSISTTMAMPGAFPDTITATTIEPNQETGCPNYDVWLPSDFFDLWPEEPEDPLKDKLQQEGLGLLLKIVQDVVIRVILHRLFGRFEV